MSSFEKFFKQADVDNNGQLTLGELTLILKKNGYKLTDQQVRSMFASVDSSGDNLISLDEYLVAMGQRPQTDHKGAIMRSTFASFDKDGSGQIDKKELTACFKEMKRGLSDAEISRMMELADKDGSGTINYEEFIEKVFGVKS